MGRLRKLSDNIYKLENFIDNKNKKQLLDIYKKSRSSYYEYDGCYRSHYMDKQQKTWIINYLKQNLNKTDKKFTNIVSSILNCEYRIILVSYPKSQSKHRGAID